MTIEMAILLCGIGGTGKSTTADNLAKLMFDNGYDVRLIRFDEFRKQLISEGEDPFSRDVEVKQRIYYRAGVRFNKLLRSGQSLVIDSGLSNESIRERLIEDVDNLSIVHVYCPLPVAVYRDTLRSWRGESHERGSYLHLRAIRDLINPFKKNKFDQPGITYEFEYPECASVHVSTFMRSPREVAREIYERLDFGNS